MRLIVPILINCALVLGVYLSALAMAMARLWTLITLL